jgi:uncharacterized membrane protein YkvA (DUF1232 family)
VRIRLAKVNVIGSFWWDTLIGVGLGLLMMWVALIVVLAMVRPRGGLLHEALRLLPDVLRLIRRLAADRDLPRRVRIRLGLLLAYLALPIDLVPDFIPILGYADDAIITTAVRRHWPGTDNGFAALRRLAGLPSPSAT